MGYLLSLCHTLARAHKAWMARVDRCLLLGVHSACSGTVYIHNINFCTHKHTHISMIMENLSEQMYDNDYVL